MKKLNLVVCKKCSWVYFSISKRKALKEIKTFTEYYNKLTKKEQKDYYNSSGPPKLTDYQFCNLCRSDYKTFKEYEGIPNVNGCTLSPILHYDEK